MTEKELALEISREYNIARLSNDKLRKLETKIREGTATFAEVDEAAEVAGKIIAEKIWDHYDSFGSGGEMVLEDGTEFFASTLTENHDYVTSLAQKIQERHNELADIGLKPVSPEFDRSIAQDIAEKAENGISERELVKECKTASRKTVDNFQKANAEAHAKAGLDVRVTRIYDGIGVHNRKDRCEWCLERCGNNMTYSEAMTKGSFQRHPGCGCEIIYTSKKGVTTRQDDWRSNQWNSVDQDRLHKIIKAARETELKNETNRVLKKYVKHASPNKGRYEIESGYKASKYANEKKYADIIFKKYGGDIKLLIPSNTQRRSDYIWNTKCWEHKTVSSLTSVDNQIHSGLGQMGDNPGGMILQMTKSIDIEKMKKTILHRLDRSAHNFDIDNLDVLVFDNEDVVLAVEWQKK